MVVLFKRGRVGDGACRACRAYRAVVVGAHAAGPSRRVGKGCGRGQVTPWVCGILLAAAQRGQAGQGIGGVEGGRWGEAGGRLASIGECGLLVVEQVVDAAHGGGGGGAGAGRVGGLGGAGTRPHGAESHRVTERRARRRRGQDGGS